jgi:hypothetical protein
VTWAEFFEWCWETVKRVLRENAKKPVQSEKHKNVVKAA